MLHLSENGNDKCWLLNFKVVDFVMMTPKTTFWEKNNLFDMVDFVSSIQCECCVGDDQTVFAVWNQGDYLVW